MRQHYEQSTFISSFLLFLAAAVAVVLAPLNLFAEEGAALVQHAGQEVVDVVSEAAALPPLPLLVHDLGVILIAATVMLLLFKWLKQPVVLGYLIAGFIVSPYFLPTSPGTTEKSQKLYEAYQWLHQYLPEVVPQILNIRDTENIHVWAELGVIFMLFGLGLEFSFKKLLAVGRIAGITGGFEVVSTTIIGFFVGTLLGWNFMDSIFFGAILAMSSTTIILKVFEELKLRGRPFAPIVFGALIVEDILAILLLVLLSSIAISGTFSGGKLIAASLEISFFILLWFVMGIYLIPWFLKICRHIINDEILLLLSVGLCFLMVIIACGVGFSSALGAFVMGSILAETSKGTHIEHVTKPVKDLFSAVFFVSVGMMIDPSVLYDYAGTIVLIIFVTVLAKFFGTGLGALLAGCSFRNSTQAGLSMAQIGEFSFIIATLGVQLGVISDWLYPVVIAVSAVTTLTTPYLILCSGKITNWLERLVPERVHLLLLRYEVVMNESVVRESILRLFWRAHGLAIMLNSVVLVGIGLGRWVLLDDHPALTIGTMAIVAGAVVVTLPFLAGVLRSQLPRPRCYDAETLERLQGLQFGVNIFRFCVGAVLVIFVSGSYLGFPSLSAMVASVCIIGFLFIFRRKVDALYDRMESRFIIHLSDKERSKVESRAALAHLVPWEATLTEFTMSAYSPLVMKTVQDSNLKQEFGVTAAIIRRGTQTIVAPQADERLLPCDRLYLIGTYEQLAMAQAVIEFRPELEENDVFDDHRFGMLPVRLHADHVFVDLAIRDCGLRDMVNGLIVGIEREGTRHLNPPPDMKLRTDDVLWLVGEKELIRKLLKGTHKNQ